MREFDTGDGFLALFASLEDAIVKKKDFYRLGGSEKHIRDITGVISANPGKIDFAYISNWADRLGLSPIWVSTQQKLNLI